MSSDSDLETKRIFFSLPPSKDLDMLKELFAYAKIKTCFQNVVEKELSTTFSNDDYDYLFLAY